MPQSQHKYAFSVFVFAIWFVAEYGRRERDGGYFGPGVHPAAAASAVHRRGLPPSADARLLHPQRGKYLCLLKRLLLVIVAEQCHREGGTMVSASLGSGS